MEMRSILLVDDEEILRRVFARVFKKRGWHVETAASATEGLERYERERFDLVLLDQTLPDGSGLSTLAKLHGNHPEARVILISGDWSPLLEKQALELGAVGFLGKPVELAMLDHIIRIVETDGGDGLDVLRNYLQNRTCLDDTLSRLN